MIKINTGGDLETDDPDLEYIIKEIVDALLSIDRTSRSQLIQNPDEKRLREISEKTAFIVEMHHAGNIRLPIRVFGRIDEHLPKLVVDLIVATSPLAKSLISILEQHGLPNSIVDRLKTREGKENTATNLNGLLPDSQCPSPARRTGRR